MTKIYVVGGANVDICGKSLAKIKKYDSNPGEITLTYGGVGRNIAENLNNLGNKVFFISVFSQDALGQILKADCQLKGLDLTYAKTCIQQKTSMYLAILNEENDMQLAISDMGILAELKKEDLAILKSLSAADYLVIDTNLQAEMIAYIISITKAKVIVDPISIAKSYKIKDYYANMQIFKPNQYEAEYLAGFKLASDLSNARCLLDYFLEQGVQEIVITLGKKGVIASNREEYLALSHDEVNVVNATGGGDAFLAAYTHFRLKNYSFMKCLQLATAASINTIKSVDTVVQEVNEELLLNVLKTVNLGGKKLC